MRFVHTVFANYGALQYTLHYRYVKNNKPVYIKYIKFTPVHKEQKRLIFSERE